MISRTLRLAYRLLRIAALVDRIEFLKKKYPQAADRIDEISTIDPTGGKFLEWLVRMWVKTERDGSDSIRRFWIHGKAILEMYTELIKSPTLAEMYGVSRDINQMDPKNLYDIWDRETTGGLQNKTDYSTEALRSKKVKQEGSRVIYDQNGYKVVQFGGPGIDPDMAIQALCMFGAGTEWCTKRDRRSRHYITQGPIYMVFKGASKVAQVNEDQIHDPDNHEIDLRKNSELTQVLVRIGIISPVRAYSLLLRSLGNRGPWPELEPALAKDTEVAFKYAYYYTGKRFPLGEKLISQNPEYAYLYAMNVIRGRFPEGEKSILSNPEFGPMYQRDLDTGFFERLKERREKKSEQIQNA